MAKATLPTNFTDDILASSMGSKRRYNVINNSDGTISLEDVTDYTQVGSTFGAAQINATNAAANAAADASKIIDDYDTLMANTQAGYMAGALAVKELNNSLFKHYDYTELIDGSIHWSSGHVNIIKQGKVVIASVMIYFKTEHTTTEYQLLSMPMLKAINCEPKYLDMYNMQTMNKVGNGSASVLLCVSNFNELGLFIRPMETVQAGDHFREELVWVTS